MAYPFFTNPTIPESRNFFSFYSRQPRQPLRSTQRDRVGRATARTQHES